MNKSIPEAVLESVARAICMACEENPDHQGDARGNEFRWQDYRDAALAAISAFTAAQKPAEYGCHCGTCTCNPNMTPAVRFDLSPAQMEGAIREHLIRLGWTPPDEHAVSHAAEIEALREEVERLRADLMESDEIREKLGHLLTRTAAALKGEPPAGVWHSWHDLPEKAAQLAEALRELEEREQSDEALLRQALEALSRAHQTAMVQTLKARIPECAEFGGIAQDLDFVVAALRERLGDGAEP